MSTPYDYITINTPTGGTSTTYTGTQISVNTPAISDVTKAEVSFTSSQSLNGYSYPWADGTGTNQITGSNRMRDWEITGSGDVVNFYPYQMSSPQYLSRLTTTIEPQQSGSGDPSPSNVRPITGFTGTNVSITGKNLLNKDNAEIGTAWNGASNSAMARLIIRCQPSTTYVLSMNGTNSLSAIYLNWTDIVPASSSGTNISSSLPYSFTTDANSKYIVIGFNKTSIAQTDVDTLKLQLELGQTSTAYEAFGNEYSVSWSDSAGTVYGGTLDVVSGQLTVTHKIISENDFYAVSSGTSGGGLHYANVNSSGYPAATSSNSLSNMLVNNQSGWGSTTPCYTTNTSGNPVRVYGVFTTLAEFKTAYAGLQIVYELATPLTYQLTATQVAMITGNNYIWTNCGTITDAGYKLTSSNNDTLTYLYAPNAGLCTGKMPTTIGLGYTYNYLSFEYYSTQAVDIDVYICGTDAKWYDTTYNRTKYVKWNTFSLPAKTSYTRYTLPTRSISLSDLTEGSGDVNSVYFEIVPTTNSPSYPMRIQHVQFDHNSASTTYVPSQNRCTYSGASSVTLYKRSAQSSSYESSYYKYLNSTVYNGSFEYITGRVTKTYASITLNSSDLTWAVYNDSSTSRAFRATISDMKSLSHSSYDSVRCFCTHASWTTSSERLGFGKFYYSYGYVYFPDYNSKRFNSVDEFTAWLDLQESRGTPVTILYPLSTPTETTLSTTTIKTLAGQNYFDTSSTAANRLPITMTIHQTSFIIPRPLNFAVQREDIYAGQYTTCTGATRADKIGWKYSDMTWSWDGLKQSDVEKLCSLSGECTLTFDDPSGDTIQESFIRSSVVSMRCRNKFENEYWWTGVSCSISFIGSHTD